MKNQYFRQFFFEGLTKKTNDLFKQFVPLFFVKTKPTGKKVRFLSFLIEVSILSCASYVVKKRDSPRSLSTLMRISCWVLEKLCIKY